MSAVSRSVMQITVVLCWVLLLPAFLRGTRQSSRQTTRRDPVSRLGMVIQGVAFALSWMGPWWAFQPSRHPIPPVSWPVAAAAALLGCSGLALVIAAIRTLGRQWSLTARIVEGHRLVTTGPYALVRNPIYTGMWGLQLATALAFASGWLGWRVLPVSAGIYYLGTILRVRSEEALLRSEFGAAFDDYARRVPALLPLPFRRRGSLGQAA
jgi:protein-S-isoprenylcysteine O-methyltransferase Ste14